MIGRERKSGALLVELRPEGRRDSHPGLRASVEPLVMNQHGLRRAPAGEVTTGAGGDPTRQTLGSADTRRARSADRALRGETGVHLGVLPSAGFGETNPVFRGE